MARKRKKYVYPVPERTIEEFKARVMRNEGYRIQLSQPEQIKYEVAKTLGIPLKQGDNGHLTTEEAGKVGGQIGGTMVKEMIRIGMQNPFAETTILT